MKKKTLSTVDWNTINSSFVKMDEKFPNAFKSEDGPSYRFISIKGIEEQLQERSVGEVVFYMDYLTPDSSPKLSKCKIIEE
jgi:hypothetical protein